MSDGPTGLRSIACLLGSVFLLKFITSEIFAPVVTGGKKRILSHSVREIYKAAGLASGAINSFLNYGKS